MDEYFSPDYVTARRRFREAAAQAGGKMDALGLEARGPNGEDLTIDIAWFGSQTPHRVLVHSSGLHGVEGFAGSAIQLQWLRDGIPTPHTDHAILLVHVLNPWGMAWLRRFNEHNVDLNRNFLGPGEPFNGAPDGYVALNDFLNPATPPSHDFFYARALPLLLRHGMPAMRQAVAGGQYDYPQGLFFGGARVEPGPARFQSYLADRLSGAARITAIDVHTGLGAFGQDCLLVDATEQRSAACHAMQAAFGDPVQRSNSEESVAYKVRGAQESMYFRLFPGAEVYFATQEFGTYRAIAVLAALRAENRWHHYGGGSVRHPTKVRLREVFGPDRFDWREAVLRRGRQVIRQALLLAFPLQTSS
ncbi:MAG TPA: M14 family metallopeptidase [Bryobacteraceae bacterium]|jgi:hypothetical protein|nr:M14 family metallopeptidase [Bryobacteraceae bacterium]